MLNRINDQINKEIMENELDANDWIHNELAWTLYWFVEFFNICFFKDQPVPIPALTFEKTRVNNLGYYRIGMNDWAVRDQINLNKLYINRPLWETLATLLHEMMHSFEYIPSPHATQYSRRHRGDSHPRPRHRLNVSRCVTVADLSSLYLEHEVLFGSRILHVQPI